MEIYINIYICISRSSRCGTARPRSCWAPTSIPAPSTSGPSGASLLRQDKMLSQVSDPRKHIIVALIYPNCDRNTAIADRDAKF